MKFLFKFILLALSITFIGNLEAINKYPLDTAYHRWSSLDDSLLYYTNQDKLTTELEIIGFSTNEQLPIYAFHCHNFQTRSKGHLWNQTISDSVKKVLIIGQHHGEEPVGVEIAMKFIQALTTDKSLNNLKEKYYFIIVPTINPEAFQIVNNGEYPIRRKNSSDTNHNGIFDIRTDGVDLNKNYPFNWEKADLIDPEDAYFKGELPASESETQAIINLATRENFDYAFSYHTSFTGAYSEVVFIPYNWIGQKSKDWKKIQLDASRLVSRLDKHYLDDKYTVHTGYTSEYGYLRDWLYSRFKTFVFTIEVGALTKEGEILYFPENNDLKTITDKNVDAVLKFLQ